MEPAPDAAADWSASPWVGPNVRNGAGPTVGTGAWPGVLARPAGSAGRPTRPTSRSDSTGRSTPAAGAAPLRHRGVLRPDQRPSPGAATAAPTPPAPVRRRAEGGIGRRTVSQRGPRDLLPDDDALEVARQVCLDQLSYRARTRAELAAALDQRGVPADVAASVLDRFTEVGLIDDAAFAQAWVARRSAAKGLSGRALAQELRRRGVADDVAGPALGALDPDDELRAARDLVERKMRSTGSLAPEVRLRRLVAMLARKGHGSGGRLPRGQGGAGRAGPAGRAARRLSSAFGTAQVEAVTLLTNDGGAQSAVPQSRRVEGAGQRRRSAPPAPAPHPSPALKRSSAMPVARRTPALGLLLAGALALAGCGGSGSDTGSGSATGSDTGAAATTSAAPADAALTAMLPEDLRSAGTLVVGSDTSYAPGAFLDEDGRTPRGFDVDLAQAVAQKLGLEADVQSAKFEAIIPGIQSGKYDLGASQFTINDERTAVVDMVSYFRAGTQWATRAGNPAGVSPDDACGKRVAVGTGSTQLTDDLPARQKACAAAGKPAIVVDAYQAQNEATAAVVSGKEDAMLADSPITAYAVKQTGGQLELAGDIYDSAPYGFVVKQGRGDLAKAVAAAVAALQADGTYGRILDTWGISGGALTTAPAVDPKA